MAMINKEKVGKYLIMRMKHSLQHLTACCLWCHKRVRIFNTKKLLISNLLLPNYSFYFRTFFTFFFSLASVNNKQRKWERLRAFSFSKWLNFVKIIKFWSIWILHNEIANTKTRTFPQIVRYWFLYKCLGCNCWGWNKARACNVGQSTYILHAK